MSLDAGAMQGAADMLYACWRDGRRIDALPMESRPSTRAEGYAVQALLERRSAKPLFGWKIAATSVAGQRHIGVSGPLAGRLLAEQVVADGGTVALGANHMRVAEPEFAFRMGTPLPPKDADYSIAEVAAAVATLHPAIEVPDSRFQDFARVGEAQLLADDACSHLFVLGPPASADWRAVDLAAHKVSARAGDRLSREGIGSNVLGGPLIALTWIANELSRLGIGLAAGQVVTTGTCMAPLDIEAGDVVTADFGAFGRVSVRFAP